MRPSSSDRIRATLLNDFPIVTAGVAGLRAPCSQRSEVSEFVEILLDTFDTERPATLGLGQG